MRNIKHEFQLKIMLGVWSVEWGRIRWWNLKWGMLSVNSKWRWCLERGKSKEEYGVCIPTEDDALSEWGIWSVNSIWRWCYRSVECWTRMIWFHLSVPITLPLSARSPVVYGIRPTPFNGITPIQNLRDVNDMSSLFFKFKLLNSVRCAK